ncbi:hypothetical protein Cgig2_011724 [Carnegiea gigantea]|uniref:Uncharacterized protein n=1 Tax=Carnegiea gigantea TaxID=171969 RepID=A0A9Q1QJQ3_9CARY|nr:hypothetical protein Cgig2_011724 [Carnegiea gigantea]
MPTSPNGATQPLIHPSMIRFGPFQPSAIGSNLPCQPPSLVGTLQVNPSTIGSNRPSQPPPVIGTSQVNPSTRSVPLHNQSHSTPVKVARDATQQEVYQEIGSTSQASRESPSNGNNDHEDLVRSSQNDQGNEEVIKGPILPRDVMNYKQGSKFVYPADKGFDKRVLKYVAKHFKQYKHGLKTDYFKPKEKTREDMCEIVPKGHSRDGWKRLVDYWCSKQHENEATSKIQERLLTSSPSKTQVEIENEVFDELMYEKENPKRPIDFGFKVDRSYVFGVKAILRKGGHTFLDNNMELKRVKEELASPKAMFLLMLKAVHNGKITDEFLDATEAALRMAGDQVPEQSSGNDLSNESMHTGPSTSASQVN